jgi:hypothetical protein
MRKLVLINALGALLTAVLSLDVANAGVEGPYVYSGHAGSHCEAPTHVSYYDPRNNGQTVYAANSGGGDSVYYVDTTPLAGFDSNPDLSYSSTQTATQDCKGTPVLRATAYVGVTVTTNEGSTHVGFPTCPRTPPDDRNPSCQDNRTGVQGGFYAGTANKSQGTGSTVGVFP